MHTHLYPIAGGDKPGFNSGQYQPATLCFSEVLLFVRDQIPLARSGMPIKRLVKAGRLGATLS